MSGNQEFCFAPVQWEMTFRYLSGNVEQTARHKTLEYRGDIITCHTNFIWADQGK